MSRTKGLVDGYWYYKVYDKETNELLAEGTNAECVKKMHQSDNHYHFVKYEERKHPNRVREFERVEREWMPYKHKITDTETNKTFIGSKAECREWMEKQMNRKLTDANFINYWYRSVGRFIRETI